MWHARFDDAALDLKNLEASLSPDEKEKAGRFKFQKDRRQAVISWAALRWLLGKYLQKSPTDLQFGYT
ncbi:MAG: hypothetical protein WA913_15415, partial [Pricia sp.]